MPQMKAVNLRLTNIRVSLIKSWKMIENTTIFHEKLEKKMSDLVRCFITFWVFRSNPNLVVFLFFSFFFGGGGVG